MIKWLLGWILLGVSYTSECFQCKPGTYSEKPGSARCTPCPADTYSNKGATVCLHCDPDKYSGVHICMIWVCFNYPLVKVTRLWEVCLITGSKCFLSFVLSFPSLQRPVLEHANLGRRARSATTSTPTLPATPRERWVEHIGRNFPVTIWCSYFIHVIIWVAPFMHPAVSVFRLSLCTSGSSPRSAVRLSKEPWSCLHRARSKPVLRATRVSSSATLPPVNPATKVPTPMEQVPNYQTPHVTLHAQQTEEPLSWCTRVFLNVV